MRIDFVMRIYSIHNFITCKFVPFFCFGVLFWFIFYVLDLYLYYLNYKKPFVLGFNGSHVWSTCDGPKLQRLRV